MDPERMGPASTGPGLFRRGAAPDGVNACSDFPGAEGFGEVVVRATLQRREGVQFASSGGEHDDVTVARGASTPENLRTGTE